MKISTQNTLIILDWDDTLFPTSWTMKNTINLLIKNNYNSYFDDLDTVLSIFLKNLQKYGTVVIITNALSQWIKISSIKLPKTYVLLKNIEIISARQNHSYKTTSMHKWKELAFKQIIDDFSSSCNCNLLNIISIGDAQYEYDALVSLNNYLDDKKKYLKSIRLINNPDLHILIEQIYLLNKYSSKIILKQNHIDKIFNMYKKIN